MCIISQRSQQYVSVADPDPEFGSASIRIQIRIQGVENPLCFGKFLRIFASWNQIRILHADPDQAGLPPKNADPD